MGIFNIFRKKEKRAEDVQGRAVTFDNAFLAALFGSEITRQKVLEIPSVQFCTELLSGIVSALPVKLYEESESGEVTEIKDDIRTKLLNGDTGDTVNGTVMRKLWVRDYFLGGGAYAYIERDIYGKPCAIYYVDESRISAISNQNAIFKDYSFSVDGKIYPKCDFIKILRNSKGTGKGTSIISECNTMFAVAYDTMKYENSVVKKGGNKKGFFTSQQQQTKESMSAIKEAWRRMNSSSEQAEDNVGVLNAGMDFKEISQSAMDMQLNQNKQTNSAQICGAFGVPSGMMTGNASAQARESFITDSLTPLLNIFETAFDSDLLMESEKGKRYFAFDTRELTRGDILKRYQAYSIGKQNGFLMIDDIRKQEDLAPIDFPYIPLGLADVLYNPKTGEIYTPNTNAVMNLRENGMKLFGRDGGNKVSEDIEEHAEELRYNPYHDPTNGRFTTSSGGGMGAVLHVAQGQKGKGEYVLDKDKYFENELTSDKDNGIIKNEDDISKCNENTQKFIGYLKNLGVENNPVKMRDDPLPEQEIINAISGGDKTKGSCVSVGFAYIGQKFGMDVYDYRGGESQSFFSDAPTLYKILDDPDLHSVVETARADITVGNKLLRHVEAGREYYMVAGKHAAIVRKSDLGKFQYLELQSGIKNGWTDFNGNPRYTLSKRFGCKGKGYNCKGYLVDIDNFENSTDFKELLGYINTRGHKQMKGVDGSVK